MNPVLRPPSEAEWRFCRMLLPRTFCDVAGREYLVAARDEAPRLVAAASFRRAGQSVTHLSLHVIPSFRRGGMASQILEYLVRSGAKSVEGAVEITTETEAAAFCARTGFERVDALTTVEAGIAGMREYMVRLRSRIVLPAGASIVPLSAAPMEQAARLHALYVAQHGELNPWRASLAESSGLHHSPVVLIRGQVAGILLWEREGDTAVVRSRAVDPLYHGGWVNATLLAEGLDGAWSSGARRVRFCYTDSNRDTRKLADRFSSEVVSVLVRYVRTASGGCGLSMADRSG